MDPKITSLGFKTIMTTGSDNMGKIAGEVASKYDVPLRELMVTVQIVDPNGEVAATAKPPYTCQYVPAAGSQGEGRARYTVKFEGVDESDVKSVRILAKATPMKEGEVCYPAKIEERFEKKPDSFAARGMATNLGKKAITGAFVHVEFFTSDGAFVSSARATLDETEAPGGRLIAGHGAPFDVKITFEEGDAGQNIAIVQARLVGKEE